MKTLATIRTEDGDQALLKWDGECVTAHTILAQDVQDCEIKAGTEVAAIQAIAAAYGDKVWMLHWMVPA